MTETGIMRFALYQLRIRGLLKKGLMILYSHGILEQRATQRFYDFFKLKAL